ncbi:LysR family transcriptional regulator [Martelella endophytica]|uniref:HTH lysR-type domain-containing protein n=1 Tax=Martelella endophytica TaxID=1486262 RepID=A0A0D5LSS5_MAREN|nr:LysR family transcriptional regulator [Martelella endophytica]AJY47005.1 hypothetical protein TM49_17055 [Martelella endophytica]
MSGMTLGELQALATVAERASFRAAAVELDISPSSLSHQISALERRIGVRLLNRTTRSVSVTAAGEAFLARVRPALRDIDDAVSEAARFRDTPSGLLRINASEGGAERLMPFVLAFMKRYPDIRIDLVNDGGFVDIVAAGFDAGVRLAESVPKGMIAVPFGGQERFVVAASPDYLARHGTPQNPEELKSHECIRARLPGGALIDWEFERGGDMLTVRVGGRLIVGGSQQAAMAAMDGLGVAYVHQPVAEDGLKAGRLIEVLGEWCLPFGGLCLYYPSSRQPSAALKAFVAALRRSGRN